VKKSYTILMVALLVGITPLVMAAKIDVFPTGDSSIDRANLHTALASAVPGDTIMLRAGVFNLTPPVTVPTDCTLDVVIPLPDGDSIRFWDAYAQQPDPCNPGAPDIFWFGERNSAELYLVDKPLTIRGEAGSSGPATVLRVDKRYFDIFLPIFEDTGNFFAAFDTAFTEADSYFFLIGAPDVTIQNVEFDGSSDTIMSFWAGTTIKDCVFRAVGQGPHFQPDERSIYPHYPANFKKPTRSKFENNVFINAQQGIHIGGSEVIVTGNVFDHYGYFGVALTPYAVATLPAAQGGEGLAHVRAVAQNNRIEDNEFVNGALGFPRIFLTSWWGGPVRENIIKNNTISGDTRGIVFAESNPFLIDGTTLSDNSILNNDIDVTGLLGVGIWGGDGSKVAFNNIEYASVGIWTEWNFYWGGGFTLVMVPATGGIVKGNQIDNTYVGIRLGAFARDNMVQKNTIQGSILADYELKGIEELWGPAPFDPTFGPASGNILKVAPGSVILDESGCTNVDFCDQYDDDSDGLFSEDPPDQLNNDGDLVWGSFPLVDEDPVEMPNEIKEK